jgi:formylglycine-generating enzyme required for sulfatase activity
MEDHPVIMVSWYGAALYCNWLNLSLSKVAPYNTATWQIQAGTDRYTLPTEAQWECAAAWSNPAGQIPRRYIFAFARDVLEPAQANYTEWTAPEGESTSLVPVFCNPLELRQFPYTTPTGYYNGENLTKDSLSPLGCRDMTGNATEWCEDRYALYTASETPQTNPRGPLTGVNRIARGGSWYSSPEVCRVSNRLMYEPDEMLAEVGFRVAR